MFKGDIILHPTILNAETPYSRKRSKRYKKNEIEHFISTHIKYPGPIPDSWPLRIITLNLAFFPFTAAAPEMLYKFIGKNPYQIYIFQEVKDTKLLQYVFDRINMQLFTNEYVLRFSSHKINHTKLCFAYRNGLINYQSHKSIFTNVFLKIPYILRPPDVLTFTWKESSFSLINLHGAPYRAHSSHLKREKFFYLLDYTKQTFNDGRFIIFGGDWNFRPPGLNKFFSGIEYIFPKQSFKNIIDYFVTCVPVGTLYPWTEITQTSLSKSILKSKDFKIWNKVLSDHFPTQYTFKLI